MPNIPIAQLVWNNFDELGELLGQKRLPLERNAAYKQRLLGVFAQRANSTYMGLINGINRELGTQVISAITITAKSNNGILIGANPAFQFSEAYLRTYGDITNTANLDLQIDRFELTGVAYTLTALVNYINANSAFFTAALLPGVDGTLRSMTLLNQTNQVQVTSEIIPCSNSWALDNGNVIQGTVFFSDTVTFAEEVPFVDVTAEGEYNINYTTGVVTVFQTPTSNTSVRYSYIKTPYTVMSSPVIIHNMQNQDFMVKMFNQITGIEIPYNYYPGSNPIIPANSTNSLVTALGAELINELMSVYPAWTGI